MRTITICTMTGEEVGIPKFHLVSPEYSAVSLRWEIAPEKGYTKRWGLLLVMSQCSAGPQAIYLIRVYQLHRGIELWNGPGKGPGQYQCRSLPSSLIV